MRLGAICCAWYSYPLPRREPGHALVSTAWTVVLKPDKTSGRPEWLQNRRFSSRGGGGNCVVVAGSFTRASRFMDLCNIPLPIIPSA